MTGKIIQQVPDKLIGIIGPGRDYKREAIVEISHIISKLIVGKGYLPFITPTLKSSPEIFGNIFKEDYPDHDLWGIDYEDPDPKEFPDHNLNKNLCDKIVNCEIWENEPKYFIKHIKHLIVFGFCTGCVWEIVLTKFYWKHDDGKIYVLRELEPDFMPERLNQKLKIRYIVNAHKVDSFDF
ncbi:MAG: hypothetical protein JXI43_04925 [Tissierellales bacterium]|nr:hypothetical protein [Tissierellales bacterium]